MAHTYNQPHEPTDIKKLASMIQTLENDGELPPVIVWGDRALTGSHRLAAWSECDMTPVVVEISDEDAMAAFENAGMNLEDEIFDFPRFCESLYAVTGDEDVKSALADQF